MILINKQYVYLCNKPQTLNSTYNCKCNTYKKYVLLINHHAKKKRKKKGTPICFNKLNSIIVYRI